MIFKGGTPRSQFWVDPLRILVHFGRRGNPCMYKYKYKYKFGLVERGLQIVQGR